MVLSREVDLDIIGHIIGEPMQTSWARPAFLALGDKIVQ